MSRAAAAASQPASQRGQTRRDERDGMKNKLRGGSAAAASLCSINTRSVSPSVFSISSVLGTECTPTAEINNKPQRDLSVCHCAYMTSGKSSCCPIWLDNWSGWKCVSPTIVWVDEPISWEYEFWTQLGQVVQVDVVKIVGLRWVFPTPLQPAAASHMRQSGSSDCLILAPSPFSAARSR